MRIWKTLVIDLLSPDVCLALGRLHSDACDGAPTILCQESVARCVSIYGTDRCVLRFAAGFSFYGVDVNLDAISDIVR